MPIGCSIGGSEDAEVSDERAYAIVLAKLARGEREANANLTATQERCTVLIQRARAMRKVLLDIQVVVDEGRDLHVRLAAILNGAETRALIEEAT